MLKKIRFKTTRPLLALALIAGLAPAESLSQAIASTPAEDQALPDGNLLFWPPEQRPTGFSNMEKIFPTAPVARGDHVHAFTVSPTPLAVHYTADGQPMDSDAFMAKNNVAGLIIIKDGTILLEKYRLGLTPERRWTSFSVAKSLTSTLIGAAIKDGYIQSINDPVTRYIPRLAGSAYDGVSIRNLITMSSGVRWNEDYEDPQSDAAQLKSLGDKGSRDMVDYMKGLPRITAPGEKFLYRTGDSNLLGVLVEEATGKPLNVYLSEKIWKPYGMEADALWMMAGGRPTGGSGLSMRLRDFARFGQFFMDGGLAGGKPVLPDGWTREATQAVLPTGWGDIGYGYQWWINPDGSYRALGIFGQLIFIDPKAKLLIVAVSAWPRADAQPQYHVEDAYIAAVRAAVAQPQP